MNIIQTEILLPNTTLKLKNANVYFVGHENANIRTKYLTETLVKNFKEQDILHTKKICYSCFIGEDKYLTLVKQRSSEILGSNRLVAAISIAPKITNDFVEMLYNDIKDNKPHYVLIDGFEELLFTFRDNDKLFMDLMRTLTNLQKISREFEVPIIVTCPLFYPEGRNDKSDMPLFMTFGRSKVLKINANQLDKIKLDFCEPIVIFELKQRDLVQVPAGYMIDLDTGLYGIL